MPVLLTARKSGSERRSAAAASLKTGLYSWRKSVNRSAFSTVTIKRFLSLRIIRCATFVPLIGVLALRAQTKSFTTELASPAGDGIQAHCERCFEKRGQDVIQNVSNSGSAIR